MVERDCPAFTSPPSVKVRFSTMPSTRARISAIRDAAVRPDNSVSTVMARGAKMRTPTSGTCMRCGIQARALQFLSRRFGKGHCNAHPSEDYRENSNRSCNDFKQPVERIFGGLVADLATIAAEALHFV